MKSDEKDKPKVGNVERPVDLPKETLNDQGPSQTADYPPSGKGKG